MTPPPGEGTFGSYNTFGSYAMRSGDWVLISPRMKGEPSGKLYNLKDDLGQQNDLAKDHPEKVAELTKMFRSIRATRK